MQFNRRSLLFAFGIASIGLASASGVYLISAEKETKSEKLPTKPTFSSDDFDGWLLSPADYDELEYLVNAPESKDFEIFNNTDFVGGGDFNSEKVLSVKDCISMCRNSDECQSFTFGRFSHTIEQKRHMCWLKTESNPSNVVATEYYISGSQKR